MAKPKKTVIEYRNYELPLEFPVLLLTGDRWHISDVKSDKLHFHNCLEIGICHTDSGIMEFGDSKQEFHAGDVTFVSRNVPHTTYSTKGTASLWSYLFVAPADILRNMFEASYPYARVFQAMCDDFRYIISEEEYPEIHFMVTQIIREMTEKKMNYQFAVKGLFLSLFMEFMRIYSDEESGSEAHAPENALVISPALDYIKEHYMENFPMEDLANLCHLSETHFRRVFNEIMNTSPLEYLNTTRILQACTLLRTSENSILEISEQVGFRSVSSFNRHFSTIMGTQPTSWRHKMVQSDKTSILQYSGWMQAQNLSEPDDE
ncbi:MAG: AraC family transcriptional regulator [Lachnospiraceae bacterium]|nr:AraC family transcriptional regulator [Lachnospiraceae bacterium]